jgi:hypothetical protein
MGVVGEASVRLAFLWTKAFQGYPAGLDGPPLYIASAGYRKKQWPAARLCSEIPARAPSVPRFRSKQFRGKKMIGQKNTGHLFAQSFFLPLTLSFDDQS